MWLSTVNFQHVIHRENNQVADNLAKQGIIRCF